MCLKIASREEACDTMDFPVRMKGKREFHPFHLLIDAAEDSLKERDNYQFGGEAFALSAIILSALAIEALANSIGKYKVPDWSDYESASPMAKLRIISSEMNIEFDAHKSPWKEAKKLIKFRNSIAHAKPKTLEIDIEITEENIHEILDPSPSEIEKEISYENAKMAVDTVNNLKSLLCSRLDTEIDSAFFVPH